MGYFPVIIYDRKMFIRLALLFLNVRIIETVLHRRYLNLSDNWEDTSHYILLIKRSMHENFDVFSKGDLTSRPLTSRRHGLTARDSCKHYDNSAGSPVHEVFWFVTSGLGSLRPTPPTRGTTLPTLATKTTITVTSNVVASKASIWKKLTFFIALFVH